MEFEWDQQKREANLKKHGIDFIRAIQIFKGDTVHTYDDRRDYGEERYIAIGAAKGTIVTVVYTWRGETIRIISARKAGKGEKEKYYKKING